MQSDDMPTEAGHDEPAPSEKRLIGVSISAELHARASAICEQRKCTLETVIEDLIQRFLPPVVDEPRDERVVAQSQLEPVKRRRMAPWRRLRPPEAWVSKV